MQVKILVNVKDLSNYLFKNTTTSQRNNDAKNNFL